MAETYQENLNVQKEYYERTAASYDEWHVLPKSALIVHAWNVENLKRFVGNQPVERCLDLGCGTGRFADALLSLSPSVYGVDASESLLALARERYPALHLALGEVTHLPYEDGFFDLVVVNGALHHFFALEATCREVARVLKPGGIFAILGEPNKAYNKMDPFWYSFIAYQAVRKIVSLFRKPVMSEEIEPDAEVFAPARMRHALEQSGLVLEQFYSYDYGPRMTNQWFLNHYARFLALEHRTLARWFPLKGMALQAFCRKK